MLAEIPYAIVAGGIYFNCWWWGVNGGQRQTAADGSQSAIVFLLVILFELYYTGFGQAIAALAPNELLASLLVPLFFLFVVSFCGVVAPPAALPEFWRNWMYWSVTSRSHFNLPTLLLNNPLIRSYSPPG